MGAESSVQWKRCTDVYPATDSHLGKHERSSTVKTLSKNLLTATVFTLGLNSLASAGELVTPTLFRGGSQNVCVATNVGSTPLSVTVEMVTLLSGTTQETCTIDPEDPNGCQNFANDLAYCRVIVQGSVKKVRAVMINRDTVSPFTIHATVQAQ